MARMAITLENITNGETVYQRALLLTGRCIKSSVEDFMSVTVRDSSALSTFPAQNWPVCEGHFKSLVILSPGTNIVILQQYQNDQPTSRKEYTITYIPLLQNPPLHLAVMVAKDSPLLIDCPPTKRGGISSAHSDIDAAINKFRMTAYMWQALTAEDMRSKGLGRRAFRLEEEWTTETLSRKYLQVSLEGSGDHMQSTAKVHLVRSDKTVAELRDAQLAQQNHNGRRRDDLHKHFTAALKAHGGIFASSAHPVVAGLILDSTFSVEQNLVVGHAALGACNPNGISLGIFGSHLTYSWPRFMEEIPSTLLDVSVPGDTVCNDNGECGTLWEACSIGQGAFLHEVGHAFGLPHTTGIMARGYAQDWPKNFLSQTAYCARSKMQGSLVVVGKTNNNARWDLSDALHFKFLPHFRLPSDKNQTVEVASAEPSIQVVFEEKSEDFLRLVISSPAEIARVEYDGAIEALPTVLTPASRLQFTIAELEARFDRTQPLKLSVLGMNGKSRIITNVWKLFTNVSFVRIPGSQILLQKRSFKTQELERMCDSEQNCLWSWAVLLNEKGAEGKLSRAKVIDSRVGCVLDGAVVYFEDDHKTKCGPRWGPTGDNLYMGGGNAEMVEIPAGADITKVEIGSDGYSFSGLRFQISDGSSGGYLNTRQTIHSLEPAEDEKIIGFYGQSFWGRSFNDIQEFGIITAPKDVTLPMSVYDLPELQNTDGGTGPKKNQHAENRSDSDNDSNDSDDDEDTDMTVCGDCGEDDCRRCTGY